jgi:hypothetical protein
VLTFFSWAVTVSTLLSYDGKDWLEALVAFALFFSESWKFARLHVVERKEPILLPLRLKNPSCPYGRDVLWKDRLL